MTAGMISSYSDIADDTIITEAPALYLNSLRGIAGYEGASFTSLLVSYLEGSGVPCPAESELLRQQGLIAYSEDGLNGVESLRFRPWAFYRACTGLNEVAVTKPAKVSPNHLLSLWTKTDTWCTGSLLRKPTTPVCSGHSRCSSDCR